jgi:hypothetical protein
MGWLEPVERALSDDTRFFFRDDDAGWGDERLLALLQTFAARSVWVDLAVIPRELDAGLARELLARERVGLHQHGLAHANHEPAGRKCEFGASRDGVAQRADVFDGRERLEALLGDRLDPIFTPPWNRCTAVTGQVVAELGFRVLSREARAEALDVPGLAELPVCADWVRLEPHELAERVAAFAGSGRPVGVMFHHEEMDAASLRRVDDLLALAGDRARPMMELAQPLPL